MILIPIGLNVQIERDIADTFVAVADLLDGVLRGLPALDVYVQIFGASRIGLLEKPLVDLYAMLITFGIEAAKLFDKPVSRKFFSWFLQRHSHWLSREAFPLVYEEFTTDGYHFID
jgi:hypothetical protein